MDAAGAHASPKGSDSIGYLPRVRGDKHENEMLWLVRPDVYYFLNKFSAQESDTSSIF